MEFRRVLCRAERGGAPKGGGGASEASQEGRGQSLPTGRPGAREVVHGFGTAPYPPATPSGPFPLSFHSGGQSFEHLDGARVVGHPHLAGRCVVGDPDRPDVTLRISPPWSGSGAGECPEGGRGRERSEPGR